jgi:type II secretory pathway component PulF
MQYNYKGKKLSGEIVEGVIDADSRRLVINKLQKMQVFPIAVKETGAGKGLNREVNLQLFQGVGLTDLMTFSRQMSDLLRAGLPLVRCLDVIVQQTYNPKMCEVIKNLRSDVQTGMAFSDAMKKHKKVFSTLYFSMIKAGEIGGMLDGVMERLALFLENEHETRSKIISAMTYPAFMVIVCFFVMIILFTVVVPNFQVMFADIDMALPIATQILWALLIAAVGGFIMFRQYLKTEQGRLQFDTLILKVPLFGELVKKREIAKFSRTLGTLLGNGVAILNALSITEQVISNQVLKNDIQGFADSIKEGIKLSDRMAQSSLFPPVAINMVAVGEETGSLEITLSRVADAFESETDRVIKTITTIIEPVMIVIMAFIVGFIVFAMIMPIFQLSQNI